MIGSGRDGSSVMEDEAQSNQSNNAVESNRRQLPIKVKRVVGCEARCGRVNYRSMRCLGCDDA